MDVYLDTAATSIKKPECVLNAIRNFMCDLGASPGRSTHKLGISASLLLEDARQKTANFFGLDDPTHLIFTSNCTEALNLAIQGILGNESHVITSGLEHNSVMRPLMALKISRNIEISSLSCDSTGLTNPEALKKQIRSKTKLIIMTHASNVTGAIQPIEEIGKIAKLYGIPVLIDAAQTAGCIPIDLHRLDIDLLAFSGHKGLMGPQGVGGLCIKQGFDLNPLKYGGTGSDSTDMIQPEVLPDKFESGTPNTPGIAGFLAALDFVDSVSVKKIRREIVKTGEYIIDGLKSINGIEIYSPTDMRKNIGVFSFSIKNKDSGEVADKLDNKFGIMTRIGLHCSPLAHKSIGTFPDGTIRASIGYYSKFDEAEYFFESLEKIANEK